MALSRETPRVARAPPDVTPLWGLAVLSMTKGLDGVTTMVGLYASPSIVEKNVLVASTMQAIGIAPALLLISIVTVVTIAVSTETATYLSRRTTSAELLRPAAIRLVGYGIPSLFHVAIATHNVFVISPTVL